MGLATRRDRAATLVVAMIDSEIPPGARPAVPLAPMTTLGVGGPARLFAEAESGEALADLLEWSRRRAVPVFVLGGGSNIVMADGGFDGLVIRVSLRGLSFVEKDRRTTVTVAGGEVWDDVVAACVDRGLAGIECLSGIPGLTGAAPIQNIGAYGQEVAETIVAVDVMSRETGERATLGNADCAFGYRDSAFKRLQRDRWVVTSVTFELERSGPPSIRYAELERALSGVAAPSLSDVRAAVLRLRRAKGMVIDPTDPDTRSAGSFFMNPVVDGTAFDEVLRRAELLGVSRGEVPAWRTGSLTKLSAAWLIERSGFAKGAQRGRAGLSTKHALAIVNRGGASAAAIRDFSDEIRGRVRDVFGVTLEPEPVFVGERGHSRGPRNAV